MDNIFDNLLTLARRGNKDAEREFRRAATRPLKRIVKRQFSIRERHSPISLPEQGSDDVDLRVSSLEKEVARTASVLIDAMLRSTIPGDSLPGVSIIALQATVQRLMRDPVESRVPRD